MDDCKCCNKEIVQVFVSKGDSEETINIEVDLRKKYFKDIETEPFADKVSDFTIELLDYLDDSLVATMMIAHVPVFYINYTEDREIEFRNPVSRFVLATPKLKEMLDDIRDTFYKIADENNIELFTEDDENNVNEAIMNAIDELARDFNSKVIKLFPDQLQ